MFVFGECDCCGAHNRFLHRAELAGCEAYACCECRRADPKDDAWEIEEEIDAINEDQDRHGAGMHRALLLERLTAELQRISKM